MSEQKTQLIELIEAYAAAKGTANTVLIQLSGSTLAEFLGGVSIEPVPPAASEEPSVEDGAGEDGEPQPPEAA